MFNVLFGLSAVIWFGFFLHFGWDMYTWLLQHLGDFLLRRFKRPC